MNMAAGPKYGDTKPAEEWKLRLFVTNWTPRCIVAYRNLDRICKEHIGDKCDIKVIDILEHPEVAREQQIVAVPTLFKLSPKPRRVLVGDFSKTEEVLKGLDVERWLKR
jgi:circadian clock protein KaiB